MRTSTSSRCIQIDSRESVSPNLSFCLSLPPSTAVNQKDLIIVKKKIAQNRQQDRVEDPHNKSIRKEEPNKPVKHKVKSIKAKPEAELQDSTIRKHVVKPSVMYNNMTADDAEYASRNLSNRNKAILINSGRSQDHKQH